MKKEIGLILLVILCVVPCFFLFSNQSAEKEKSPQPTPSIDYSAEDFENYVDSLPDYSYSVGYEKGRRAFFIQMGKKPEPVEKYSSSDQTEIEDEEEYSRGYVDGYHRAGEMFYCPR